ncbi:DNA polymerase/3'-5' exonuclease PolX [Ralstonia solanacearum]|uniref:DNA polymerase/3'-5' exonuclease PolX n=1 Tax=Ralstonia solanacearum TaxID=305 RepID=UPI0023059E45|nr:DNA polymerase/3'-5' exonuclease PolX [Ralstonia solanacearum]MDB0509607.1 DNA polymerase/3'-5' exonuclease PolX [Ralstonia solanacearum]MDB0515539.1 DNA polymerase/3'-5' exonuclease PolX [Ralstonia solanacearum]
MNQRVPAKAEVNQAIASIFNEIADLLEIEEANPFRVRAYRNAARVIDGLVEGVDAMIARGADLTRLPAIGVDLAAKMREIVETGTCAMLARLRGEVPPATVQLLQLPGLGPKRARALQHELGIATLDDLAAAAQAHRIQALHGFGAKTEARLLTAVGAHLDRNRRFGLDVAKPCAEALMRYLRAGGSVEELVVAGSYRRGRDTVGDLDLLATARHPIEVMRQFAAYDQVATTISSGTTRASAVLKNGMQVDLRVVRPAAFGAALVYFTGSKAHNVALRKLAQAQGLKINEYGVFRDTSRLAGQTEASVYQAVGLPWICPELREDRGEIEAARNGTLPCLVEVADLRGDLHVHTSESDGTASLEEMAQEARRRHLHYIAITDHSPHLGIAHGLTASRLAAQGDAIDRFNAEHDRAPLLLKGIEVDILEDGSLDLPDAVLGRLDLVVGAIHSHFDLPGDKQTARILRAIEHPHFSILAHPFGRLLGRRDACDIDLPRILRALAERGSFIEVNAQPSRLDLSASGCELAKAAGVLVSIASDAHRPADFGNLPFGVIQARRAWMEPKHVLNARTLPKLREMLRKTL